MNNMRGEKNPKYLTCQKEKKEKGKKTRKRKRKNRVIIISPGSLVA
jgi:hypothetical protein